MFTARATTSPTVTSAATDWTAITSFAIWVSGIVSVGLNAVAFELPEGDDVGQAHEPDDE